MHARRAAPRHVCSARRSRCGMRVCEAEGGRAARPTRTASGRSVNTELTNVCLLYTSPSPRD
eukprot:10034276-Alexandrium_andersonii.AAC.1